ncbi:MAG: two-component system response regulator OmpR [Burkholderiaceae bacterium]|jgi:two-component system phosphate regulon response regulator OmpR
MTPTNTPAQVSSKRSPGTQAKILVVDDDARLRELLKRFLTEHGFAVTTAPSAIEMNRFWIRERYDLLVLDLMLPGEDGLSICQRLRGGGDNTPIIMLTAKGDDADRITGLEIGADDYLAKPFNPRELLARIAAVLRRVSPDEIPGAPSDHAETYLFGEFEFDLGKRLLSKNGQTVTLTTGEYSVLKVLARHAKQPLSREKLMELSRGREYEVFDRSLDVQISRLRKLIEPNPASPRFIQTVWGLGYVFIPDDQQSER